MQRLVTLLLCLSAISISGCVSTPQYQVDGDGTGCYDQLLGADKLVSAAGAGDAETTRVPGVPYLRTNRFLASFNPENMTNEQFQSWIQRMRDLDQTAREIEIANIPSDTFSIASAKSRPALTAAVEDCADTMMNRDLTSDRLRAVLDTGIEVPDNYIEWQRWLGVYPLSALPIAIGYNRWKDANLKVFEHQSPTDLAEATFERYAPPPSPQLADDEIAAVIAQARKRDPLSIPRFSDEEVKHLLGHFAPIWMIETVTDDDLIGTPYWQPDGPIQIDVRENAAYSRISFTRWGDQILTQLNYLVWFPGRPKQGSFDMLGGHLDGIIWRVTLGPDGRPLVYDTIHACGCYHLFFPAPPLRVKPLADASSINEDAVAPVPAPNLEPGQRIQIRVASVSHYVTGVTAITDEMSTTRYELRDEIVLRSLPKTNGNRRSLYRPDGIVDGTERGERVFLWPMGIPSPGAMRQWGNHATAFVGRRHFDDPWLLDTWFWTATAESR